MKSKFATPRDILKFDYENRRKKNPRYSQRAYAQLLGVSSGRLTEILSGKAPITNKKAQSIVRKLDLDLNEKQFFLRLVESENNNREDGRRKPSLTIAHRLQEEEFKLISDWEYFPFMSLIETATFKSDIKWISKKLGLPINRTEEVLNRLVELGFVKVDGKGKITNTHRSMSTTNDIPSEVLRKANADCILHALEKMNTVDIPARDITSMTFPVDPRKMNEAKDLIREFKMKMAKLMRTRNTSEIYNLNLQLVPVSQLGV